MIYIKDTKKVQLNINNKCAVALGKFDGIHEGHMLLVDELKNLEKKGFSSILFTFDYKENSIFDIENMKFIYTREEKKRIAEDMDIDILFDYPFDDEFASMDPKKFVKEILCDMLKAAYVVVGEDFRFGANRSGDINLLKEMSKELDFQLIAIKKKCSENGDIISSTSIRKLISKGDMSSCIPLLGRPYSLEGVVQKGKQLGRTIGIPTANLHPEPYKLYPPAGVYASRILITKGGLTKGIDPYRVFKGITNIGDNPTVNDEGNITIETNIFGFDDDIYDCGIRVYLMDRIRGEIKFDSIDSLKKQMEHDILKAKEI